MQTTKWSLGKSELSPEAFSCLRTDKSQRKALSNLWMDKMLMPIWQYVEPYKVSVAHGGTPRAVSGIDGPVRIAILDSGFDPDHPLLVTDEGTFEPRIKGFQNFVAGRDADEYQDEIGHGTHALGLLLKIATCAEIYIARIANQETLGRDSYSAISKVSLTTELRISHDTDRAWGYATSWPLD
jgi:hypothetical protein